MTLNLGAMAERKKLEAISNQTIPDEFFTHYPVGSKILVLQDTPPERHGHIIIPNPGKEPMGVGWIMAAGPRAGLPTQPYPGGVEADTPVGLLYHRVVFGAATGIPIRLSVVDRDFQGQVLLMNDRDVRAVDTDPRPAAQRGGPDAQ